MMWTSSQGALVALELDKEWLRRLRTAIVLRRNFFALYLAALESRLVRHFRRFK